MDHVPQLAGLVKIPPAALDAHLLRHRDLDMVNGVVIPVGGENGVGKPQGQQIHDRFLAQVMVDPVNLVLGEAPGDGVVDLLGGGQVTANGFFQHHPGSRRYHAGMGQPLANVVKQKRGHRKIVDQHPFFLVDDLRQPLVLVCHVQIDEQIMQPGQQPLDHLGLQGVGHKGLQAFAHPGDKVRLFKLMPGDPDDPGVVVQQAGLVQLVK